MVSYDVEAKKKMVGQQFIFLKPPVIRYW